MASTRYRIEGLVGGKWRWQNVHGGGRLEGRLTFNTRAEADTEVDRLTAAMVKGEAMRLRVATTTYALNRVRQLSTFTLSHASQAKLERMAVANGLSKSAMVERLIQEAK